MKPNKSELLTRGMAIIAGIDVPAQLAIPVADYILDAVRYGEPEARLIAKFDTAFVTSRARGY